MALLDEVIKSISETVAVDLIRNRGKNNSKGVIALRLGELFDELDKTDISQFVDLVSAYIEGANVHVGIPTYRYNSDGSKKTEEELRVDPEGY